MLRKLALLCVLSLSTTALAQSPREFLETSGSNAMKGNILPNTGATRVVTPTSHTVGDLFSDVSPKAGGLAIVVPADGRPIIFWMADDSSVSALRSARCTDTSCTSLSSTANLTGFVINNRQTSPGATILPNGEVWVSYGAFSGAQHFAKCSNADCSAITAYNLGNWGLENWSRASLVYNPTTGSLTEFSGGPTICRDPGAGCTDRATAGVSTGLNSLGWINPATNFPIMLGRTGSDSVRVACSDDHCGSGSTQFSQLTDITHTIAAEVNPISGLPAILYGSITAGGFPNTPYTYKYVKCTDITCSSMTSPVAVATTSVAIPGGSFPSNSGLAWAAVRGDMAFDLAGRPILSFSLGNGTNEMLLCSDDTCTSTTLVTRPAGFNPDSYATTALAVASNGDVFAVDGRNSGGTNFTVTSTPLGSYVFSGVSLGSTLKPLAGGVFSGDVSAGSVTVTRDITLSGILHAPTISMSGRLKASSGGSTASANNLTLGQGGNFFSITGTTTINGVSTAGWTTGSVVTLQFTGSLTVKHNTAAGAGFASLKLAGGVDFSATADDTLTMVYNGTYWVELSRSVI